MNNEERPGTGQHPRYLIPDYVREALLDFTVAFLLERPGNFEEFAMDFFRHRTASSRQGQGAVNGDSSGDIEPEADVLRKRSAEIGRRPSIFAEPYNPEEDEDDKTHHVHPKTDEQRKRLCESVKNILIFRELNLEQMQAVVDAMSERNVEKDEIIINQGDDGDNFYVVQSGKFRAFISRDKNGAVEQEEVGSYENDGSFGELALMYNTPRAATIKAETKGLLWVLDRETFRKIVLKKAFLKRKQYESLIDSVPMLKALKAYERLKLADALTARTFTDEIIISQGDHADGMYFVEDGAVKITLKDAQGVVKEINQVTNGGYFGELALLTHKPRAASVYAVGTVQLAFLDVDAFERLLGPCIKIMKRNAEGYEEQLRNLFGGISTDITDIRWHQNVVEP